MKHNTSWGKVADWYDEYLGSEDSYQKAVILPNLMRVLDPKQGDRVIDIACGQGFFTEQLAERGVNVLGVDISQELVTKAAYRLQEKKLKNAQLLVSSADDLSAVSTSTMDNAICVLAAQNIEKLDKMFEEAARVLKRTQKQDKVGKAIRTAIKQGRDMVGSSLMTKEALAEYKTGRLILVINHPSFRIPQSSDWHFNDKIKKQGRVVYQYMSEGVIKIDMNPGSRTNKKYTISYHRPLQVFVKWLTKHGFAVTRIEEWTSHKTTKEGPRAKAENDARKEIPMFMCIEATLIR